MLYENRGHTQIISYIDADLVGLPTDRRSTSGYCVFVGGNLISYDSQQLLYKIPCLGAPFKLT